MDKKLFMDYLPEELLKMGIEPKFRVKQLYNWVYRKYVDNFEDMKNIPKLLRQKLQNEFIINPFELINHEISLDETEKFLFKLKDERTVETVLIKMKENKYTVCVSTQVGCKVGCAFCLTAKGGFVRNLSAGEIVAQVWWMKKFKNFDENKALNVVYMGMGEPLDNYDNLVKAIKILSHPDGMNISTRRQTVSTSGIAPKIKKLGNENLGVNLAISLHAVDNETREKLIPMNKAYNIESVIDAIREFPIDKDFRYIFMNFYLFSNKPFFTLRIGSCEFHISPKYAIIS
jgi:23S rRNA (adenine2503-C2)-methyltransferase